MLLVFRNSNQLLDGLCYARISLKKTKTYFTKDTLASTTDPFFEFGFMPVTLFAWLSGVWPSCRGRKFVDTIMCPRHMILIQRRGRGNLIYVIS